MKTFINKWNCHLLKLGRWWEDRVWELGVRSLALVMLSSEHLSDLQVELLSKQEEMEAWGSDEKFGLEVNIRGS